MITLHIDIYDFKVFIDKFMDKKVLKIYCKTNKLENMLIYLYFNNSKDLKRFIQEISNIKRMI